MDRFRERLDAVIAAPDDDAPRLIVADDFDDARDPRGRLIRTQLALARLPPEAPSYTALLEEEQRLLAAHDAEWVRDFRGQASGFRFHRGFVEELKMTARQFLAHGDAVFARTPVRHLHLLDAGSHLEAVLNSPLLERLHSLTIYAQYLGIERRLAEHLASAPKLARLRRLSLGRNRLRDDGVAILAASEVLSGLEELDLSENEITDHGIEAIVSAGHWPHLKRINLTRNAVGPQGAIALALSPARPVLDELNLESNAFLGQSAGSLADLLRVRSLNLADTMLLLPGIERLCGSPEEAAIRHLNLRHNLIGDRGAERIAMHPALTSLESLNLAQNEIGDDGAEALSRSEALARLRTLDLRYNPIGTGGLTAFLLTPLMTQLRRLDVPDLGVPSPLRDALAQRYAAGRTQDRVKSR